MPSGHCPDDGHRSLGLDPVPQSHRSVCGSKQAVIRGLGGRDRTLITAKEVRQEMWTTLWRELALLPQQVTAGIIGSIWEAKPEMSGPFPLT
jgi:hypothetical protein